MEYMTETGDPHIKYVTIKYSGQIFCNFECFYE